MTQEGEAAGILSEVEEGVVDELEEGEYVEGEDEELNTVATGELRTRPTFSHKDLHAEQWDDSALIEAWDAAVREYQRPATNRREKKAEKHQQANTKSATGRDAMEVDDTQQSTDVTEIVKEPADQNHENVENGSTTTQDYVETQRTSQLNDQNSYQNGVNSDGVDYPPGQCASCGVPTEMPSALPEDEDLANVMMAWYYAGYYGGIYTAKQKQRNQ
ncbi:hypothetical protein SpCBS45565_g06772 [Spizellomyces sp. 'palustris']|nr:hypothetical protein SpCBS45565_g06772 [Spizellomyces sp. 'palustris']